MANSISAQLFHGIKSRPVYAELAPDPTARAHLLLCEHPEPAVAWAETWVAVHDSRAIPGSGARRQFRSVARMLAALRHRLAAERVGLRLCARGTEPFIWDVAAAGEAAGMGPGEIAVAHAGSLRRRVQCVHCKTTIDGVATSLVDCPGCAATLFVRDHFSRRLAAFQGVAVDAEALGVRPAPERLYP